MIVNEYYFSEGPYVYSVVQWECLRERGEACACPRCRSERDGKPEPECRQEKHLVVGDCIPDDAPGFGLDAFFRRWDR